jgi:hypothetical protein
MPPVAPDRLRPEGGGAGTHALRQEELLIRIRHIGAAVFVLQLLGLMIWSSILYSRYSLTVDFAGGEQAWYLMAHGHLNPVVGPFGDTHFLRNHAEVILLALAPLYWIWHSGVTLLWVQDAAAVATAWIAFMWILRVVGESAGTPSTASGRKAQRGGLHPPGPANLAALGLVLLVINPWVVWTTSFDFHIQTMATCFAMLAAFDLAHGRRRAWVWVILCLSCGDVAATFVFGVGLSAVVAGRATRRAGTLMMVGGLGFVGALTAGGANLGSGLSSYAPTSIVGSAAARSASAGGTQTLLTILRAMITHPQSYLAVLWGNVLNIYANMSPAGFLGMASAWGFGVPLVVLLSNGLQAGPRTSLDSFQNFPIYAFLTLGTVIVLAGSGRRWPRATWAVAVLVLVNAIVWSAVWVPKVKGEWLQVSAATADALASVTQRIPSDDEVVTSQGISGPIPDRGSFLPIVGSHVPVQRRHVWFVITPQAGIETDPASLAAGQLGYLTGALHGRLVADTQGVFAVVVTPPSAMRTINLPTHCSVTPGWALRSSAGRPLTNGSLARWGMTGTGRPGYLVYGAPRRLSAGTYTAAVSLRSAGPLTLEVWDNDRSQLLERQEIPPTGDTATVDVGFTVPGQSPRPSTAGFGLWRTSPQPPPSNDQIEIRITTPGSPATVYSTRIHGAAGQC